MSKDEEIAVNTSLLTPFGKLSELELDSDDVLYQFLHADKHQLLEGLFYESILSEIFLNLEKFDITMVNGEVVKAIYNSDGKWKEACWWVSVDGTDNSELVALLNKKFNVLEFSYDEEKRNFHILRWYGTKGTVTDIKENTSIQDYLKKARNFSEVNFSEVSKSVRDNNRSKEAFFKGLKALYGDEVFKKLVVPRLLKNFAISPFFSGVWDVDNIVRLNGARYVQIEVKHKYPISEGNEFYFGINNGQVNVINDLTFLDVDTVHLILVKPNWNDVESTVKYAKQQEARKVLLVATYIDRKKADEISKSRTFESPPKTNFDGKRPLKYKRVCSDNFHLIGTLDEPKVKLAEKISAFIKRDFCHPLQSKDLQVKA